MLADIKEPHLDFLGAPTAFHTTLPGAGTEMIQKLHEKNEMPPVTFLVCVCNCKGMAFFVRNCRC